jgi:hypothetical protein
MQRPGSAERDEGHVAGVDATLDRDHPDGLRHLRARHAGDPRRGLVERQPELVRQAADRALGC